MRHDHSRCSNTRMQSKHRKDPLLARRTTGGRNREAPTRRKRPRMSPHAARLHRPRWLRLASMADYHLATKAQRHAHGGRQQQAPTPRPRARAPTPTRAERRIPVTSPWSSQAMVLQSICDRQEAAAVQNKQRETPSTSGEKGDSFQLKVNG